MAGIGTAPDLLLGRSLINGFRVTTGIFSLPDDSGIASFINSPVKPGARNQSCVNNGLNIKVCPILTGRHTGFYRRPWNKR